jgi:hypothetical protein
MTARFSIGIDLGTTNSVLAYSELDGEQPQVRILPIPQVVAPRQIESYPFLPSFLYMPTQAEIADGSLLMPDQYGTYVVGQYARRISAEQPDRTIAAAKSWLCHGQVDRRQAILPWDAAEDVKLISPVRASEFILQHLAQAWDRAMPDAPLREQSVVLTVPASFDVVARELTREAAIAAGLPEQFVFLEEPQAAVYHWIGSTGEQWRRQVQQGDTILVCDVGGGTTDLTLVQVEEEAGTMVLRRLAVGDHLLVGGDNMDVALAHASAQRFAEQGVKLNAWQSVSLWHACRNAKEALLSTEGADSHSITVQGRGRSFVGGSVSVQWTRAEAEQILIEGFFPSCGLYEVPRRQTASGFLELGLPFEADTGITRHVAAFLTRHRATTETGSAGPDHPSTSNRLLPNRLLFNGGVFKSDRLRHRLKDVLGSWTQPGPAIGLLEGSRDLHQQLDQSVAWGAAHYGWSKERGGIRIRGGVARSYYIGLETAGLAVPGMPRPLRAVCVVPFGMEEGTQIDVPGREVGLVVAQEARFRFFSSQVRQHDEAGQILRQWDEFELVETAPLELTLPAEGALEGNLVPVRFQSVVTELGMLELWCISSQDQRRWKMEFNVRDSVAQA